MPNKIRSLAGPLCVAALGFATLSFVHFADPTTPGGIMPTCPSKLLFGVCCPGCGASRMVYSLTEGDLQVALHFNALAVLFIPLLVWSFIAWSARRLGYSWRSWEHWEYAPTMALGALCTWFLLRNLPFAPFAALWV